MKKNLYTRYFISTVEVFLHWMRSIAVVDCAFNLHSEILDDCGDERRKG